MTYKQALWTDVSNDIAMIDDWVFIGALPETATLTFLNY